MKFRQQHLNIIITLLLIGFVEITGQLIPQMFQPVNAALEPVEAIVWAMATATSFPNDTSSYTPTAMIRISGVTPTPLRLTLTLKPLPTITPFPVTSTPLPIPSPTPTPTRPPVLANALKDVEVDATGTDIRTEFQTTLCGPDKTYKLGEGQIVVPILLYHFVGRSELEREGQSTTRYNVTASDFEAQLALLQELDYHTVTISEVAAAIRGEQTLPNHPIAITVDDGWAEQYTVIFKLLKKYNMRATFFIPSSYPIGKRMVTWPQLKRMVAYQMEIGSHTHRHVNLTFLDQDAAWTEINYSKKVLEEKLGVTIKSIAYPYGYYSSTTLQLVQQAGYEAGIALGSNPVHNESQLYTLNRVEIFGTNSLADFLHWLPWRGQNTALCAEIENRETENQGSRIEKLILIR
ncbi:MAG: polysaccharide deacetylase family protein [Anaerolineae bacterium]|nr:polysaccharide deacetylase family protein [Anaerolineae bacterium]